MSSCTLAHGQSRRTLPLVLGPEKSPPDLGHSILARAFPAHTGVSDVKKNTCKVQRLDAAHLFLEVPVFHGTVAPLSNSVMTRARCCYF